jgi:hypothetical protein
MRDGTREEEERVKIRLLLTQSELETLDRAVRESGALTRTFLIFEAIQAGLQNPTPKIIEKKRNRRVDAWTSADMKHRIQQFADNAGMTQQTLLRHFLLTYLAAKPWKPHPTQPEAESKAEEGEVRV